MQNDHKHYYLIAGTLTIIPQGVNTANHEGIATLSVNTIMNTAGQRVTLEDLKKATTSLQLRFRAESEDANSIVSRVVIDSISYLGHMSEAMFTATAQTTTE